MAGKYSDAITRLQEELKDPNLDSPDQHLAYLASSYEKDDNHSEAIKVWKRFPIP